LPYVINSARLITCLQITPTVCKHAWCWWQMYRNRDWFMSSTEIYGNIYYVCNHDKFINCSPKL
jgi:hypothetical protein